jgi:hypothetical protein
MRLSVAEIVNKATELKTVEEKVEWLRKHDSIALRTVLKFTYDKDVEFLIPNTPPPWKKNQYVGVEGMLYNEARRLKIFIKGGGYDNLNKVKREQLFISLLEDIDNADAELLCKMIAQKPLNGLSKNVVIKAFPQEFPQETVDNSKET